MRWISVCARMKQTKWATLSLAAASLLVLVLQVAACARVVTEPSRDRISTDVAATLTAAPSLTPSSTPPPSATTVPTPSSTPTATSTTGPSPTPTPPALPPDDPRHGINLAEPHYIDGFLSQDTWSGPNFEGALNVWEDGRMRATDRLVDFNIWWSTTKPEIDAMHVYAEITAEVGECRGKDSYGFAVRVSGELRNSGNTLEFSCDGHYRMRKFVSGSVTVLIDWTPSEAIVAGPNATNQMGILARGNQLYAFANGKFLDQVQDQNYNAGTYGIFASAIETAGVTVYFDDFMLWFVEP